MGDDQYILVKGGKTVVDLIEPDKRIVPLSWEPRIFLLLKNLLTEEECDHIVKRASTSFARTAVVDRNGSGLAAYDEIRNSEGAWLNRRSDSIVSKVNERISLLTHLPVSHQEDLQVLKCAGTRRWRAR